MNSGSFFHRQRAILFDDEAASGATLGHYCTIIDINPFSRQLSPTSPDAWWVRIFLPHLQEYREVRANQLLGIQERDDAPLPPPQPKLEFVIDATTDDNQRVAGQYRFGRRWENFVFEKRPQAEVTYDLFAPVDGPSVRLGHVHFAVPMEAKIDHAYVREALKELFKARRVDVA